MVAIAEAIIERRSGEFEPESFRDHYQDALRELVDSKLKGRPAARARNFAPDKVIDLMDALRRSIAAESGAEAAKAGRRAKRKAPADLRQRHMLLPVSGGAPAKPAKARPVAVEAAPSEELAPKRRRKTT
jgi:DNA end-binding protein Ku